MSARAPALRSCRAAAGDRRAIQGGDKARFLDRARRAVPTRVAPRAASLPTPFLPHISLSSHPPQDARRSVRSIL
jgi:hypothetical protein